MSFSEFYSEGHATNMNSAKTTIATIKLKSDGVGLWLFGKNSSIFKTDEEGPTDGYYLYTFFDTSITGEDFNRCLEKVENDGVMSIAFASDVRISVSGGHLRMTHFGMSKLVGLINVEARFVGASYSHVTKIPFIEVFSKNMYVMSSKPFNRIFSTAVTMDSSIITVLSYDDTKVDKFAVDNPYAPRNDEERTKGLSFKQKSVSFMFPARKKNTLKAKETDSFKNETENDEDDVL